jgi:hypothetical protein
MFGGPGNTGQPEGDQYVGELQTAIEGAHRVATFTMIPFFALLAPDHELPSIWLPTNTIKLISIPPLIFDTPLLLGISCPLNDLLTQFLGPLWNLAVLT